VPNHFAVLELPARPWLELELAKAAFHRLGAARHPDAPGGSADAFAAVNAAWQILRDPARRLRHLLELLGAETAASTPQIPPALADLFMEMAPLPRKADDFRRRLAAADGALAKALLAAERHTLQHDLQHTLARLDALARESLAEIRAIDAVWEQRDAAALAGLSAAQQTLAFTSKWSDQLREALFQLGA
jgi:hypothetical protein